MTVSYAIMAHPSRRAFVDELLATIGDMPVAWAEPPYAAPGYRVPVWRTCREAMRMHTDAEYHCVIQDDALPCLRFRERVEALATGDYLYALFYRNKGSWPEVKRLARPGVDFTVRGRLLGPAVVYPTRRIEDCIEYCDRLPDSLGSDDRIKVWAKDRGVDTYFPIPSLVDHRVGPSFLGHPKRRTAWRLAT